MRNNPYTGPLIELNPRNLAYANDLDIVAFCTAESVACDEYGEATFITRDGNVYHTNFVDDNTGITWEDLCCLLPFLRKAGLTTFEVIDKKWNVESIGSGMILLIKKEIYAQFKKRADSLLMNLLIPSYSVYDVWEEAVLDVLEQEKREKPLRNFSKAISAKPDIALNDRWLLFVDCFYRDKPRLAELLRHASITKESQMQVIAIPVRNSP